MTAAQRWCRRAARGVGAIVTILVCGAVQAAGPASVVPPSAGSASVAGAVAPAGPGSAVAGVVARIDLAQRDMVVAGQRYRWDPRRLRVSIAGQPADLSSLREGQFVILQLDGPPADTAGGAAAERRIVAIQVGTVH